MSSDQPSTSRGSARRDLLFGLGAFGGFIVLSLAILLATNPGFRWDLFGRLAGPKSSAPIEITLLHTNDTRGYTEPCG